MDGSVGEGGGWRQNCRPPSCWEASERRVSRSSELRAPLTQEASSVASWVRGEACSGFQKLVQLPELNLLDLRVTRMNYKAFTDMIYLLVLLLVPEHTWIMFVIILHLSSNLLYCLKPNSIEAVTSPCGFRVKYNTFYITRKIKQIHQIF